MNTNNIIDLLNNYQNEFESYQTLHEKVKSFVLLLGSKFFDIIYNHTNSTDEKQKRELAKEQFEKLQMILNISFYKKVPLDLLNLLITECNIEEIESEFQFLENYFINIEKNNQKQVMKKIIIGAQKKQMIIFIEASCLLCEEYNIKEKSFLNTLKNYQTKLEQNDISLEDIEEIYNYLIIGDFSFHETKEEFNKILKLIHNKTNFLQFLKEKTRASVQGLNEYIEDIDNQFLSPGDFPKLEEVIGFCEDLRKKQITIDIEFLKEFKMMAKERKVAESFELVVQKFPSFKDLYERISNKEEFTRKKILQILEYSTMSIKYTIEKEININCTIKYSQTEKREIKLKELFELKNKIQLKGYIENEDKSSKDLVFFAEVIQQVDNLLTIMHQLLEKGDPNVNNYEIKIENSKISIIIDNSKSSKNLKEIHDEYTKRLNELTEYQKETYKKENSIEVTFVYGKLIVAIHHILTTKNQESIKQLEPFFNYFTNNQYSITKLYNVINQFRMYKLDDLNCLKTFVSTDLGNFLKTLLKECKVKTENLFQKSLILNVDINPGIYTSLLKIKAFSQETIIEIYLKYTNNLPIPQTLFLCNQNTTVEEITAFVYRAIYYPQKILFGITQIEFLQFSVREALISIIEEQYPQSNRMKSILVLFYFNKLSR